MGFKEHGRTHRVILRLVSRAPPRRALFALDVYRTHPRVEARDVAFNRSIQLRSAHLPALADVPFWTVIDLTSQASSHSPTAPRTEPWGGGPDEDQPTSASQAAISCAPLGSMWPSFRLRVPEGMPNLLDRNRVAGSDLRSGPGATRLHVAKATARTP